MTGTVRAAGPDDVDDMVALVYELVDYERAPGECRLTAARLQTALFGADPVAHALVAEQDGAVVGVAIWFRTFSTWEGVAGMHLEDLYVRAGHRGGGHGARLLAALARICDERGWAAWSGTCWTGTSPPSISTSRWAPGRRKSGPPTD